MEKGLVHIEKAIKEERQFIRSNGEVLPIEKIKHVSKESIEHLAKLLDIWLTCCIINRSGAFGKYSSHNDIGSPGHRRFIKQNVCAVESFWSCDIKKVLIKYITEICTQFLKSKEVCVKTSSADFVTTRFW